MNKELYNAIKKHNIHPKSYIKKGKIYIVDDNNKRLVIKLNTNNYDIYKYLLSRDFPNFPINYSDIDDNYDILEYVDDLSISKEQKINDYIQLLALLHRKTSYKREVDLDEIKEKYEAITNKISYLRNYYHNLNDVIDKETFMSPSIYLLVCNVSLIYKILNKSLSLLNEVYESIKNEKSIRVSLLHNNIDFNHIIVNNQSYLISWDKAYFDNPIYELESFYRKFYHEIEINDFFKIYESINKLSNNEKKLLLILLSIPKEIHLTDNAYKDTKLINDEIAYLNKVYELLEYSENKA